MRGSFIEQQIYTYGTYVQLISTSTISLFVSTKKDTEIPPHA
ncbi:hypothetical protein B4147_3939 [Bacillus wiedmannii]|uniref:Uncharacterized protein n=1 Tax=Bacillus wiedmannii TaxID=1890302 RepID=A0A0G8CHV9_9BACI|nr:hypothetical protein B4147_3939 [Bacillus wiedmannii]